jgi:hypothetical protein
MQTRIGLCVQLDFVGMDPFDNEIHWGEVGSISLEFPEWKIAEAITGLACNVFHNLTLSKERVGWKQTYKFEFNKSYQTQSMQKGMEEGSKSY